MTDAAARPSLALRMLGGATGLLALRQAWLIRHAVRSQRFTEPFQARPRQRRARLLMVGDSTGVGAGVKPEHSLPGLLASAYEQLEIVNACSMGARVRDTLEQVERLKQLERLTPATRRYDVALILAGGNDVLRMTDAQTLRGEATRLLKTLSLASDCVIWMGCADLGVAPAAVPPVSWWLSWRTRRVMQLIAQEARMQRAGFIDFCDSAHTLRFANDPARYFASDGVHPSEAAHRCSFMALDAQLRELGVCTETWTHSSRVRAG